MCVSSHSRSTFAILLLKLGGREERRDEEGKQIGLQREDGLVGQPVKKREETHPVGPFTTKPCYSS